VGSPTTFVPKKEKQQTMKKTGSLGDISFVKLVTEADLGVRTGTDSELVRVYLDWSEGYAEYWLQMRNGAVLLQMVPDSPDSGEIYILNSINRTFYLVHFADSNSNFTKKQFEHLVSEYQLLDFACCLHRLETLVQKVAAA
jgi:hypothetical protein